MSPRIVFGHAIRHRRNAMHKFIEETKCLGFNEVTFLLKKKLVQLNSFIGKNVGETYFIRIWTLLTSLKIFINHPHFQTKRHIIVILLKGT